jgi:hypothetical protein
MTVSLEHEGLALLFRNRPSLAAELLTQVFALPLPPFAVARAESAELTRVVPDQFFADSASLYYGPEGKPLFGILVEVQREPDTTKHDAWPVYLSVLRAQHRCPVWLLVVAPTPAVARWAAEPIALGHPGFVLTPLVLSPEATPLVTDPARARAAPELAVLSAVVHGSGARGAEVALAAFDALAAAFLGRDDERLRVYQDLVDSSLSDAARHVLEAIMANGNYVYQGPFAQRYIAEGKAEGEAKGLRTAVLDVCELMGIVLDPAQRAQLEAMSVSELEALRVALKQTRRWPSSGG